MLIPLHKLVSSRGCNYFNDVRKLDLGRCKWQVALLQVLQTFQSNIFLEFMIILRTLTKLESWQIRPE